MWLMLKRFQQPLILCAMIFALGAHHAIKNYTSPPVPDGYAYYGYSLKTWGIYGYPQSSDAAPEPGIGRAPLYPIFLASMMHISPTYTELVKNALDKKKGYSLDAGIVPYVQMGMMSIVGIVIFLLARMFGSNLFFAYLCSFAVLARLMGMAYHFRLSETLSLPLFALTSYFLALWFRSRPNLWYLAGAGLCLGLLSLTRVVHFYFVPLVLVAIVLLPTASGRVPFKQLLKGVGVFALMSALVIGPWMMRNASNHGNAAIGDSGTPSVYALRILYNTMTFKEAIAGSVYWLPDFGDKLGVWMFPEAWKRYDFSNPEGFRLQRGIVVDEVRHQLEEGESLKKGMQKALLNSMIENPVGYVLSFIPLTVRGLRHVWVYVPFALIGLWYLRREKYFMSFAGASLMTLLTYAIHVAVTHFRGRYGQPMLIGFVPFAAVGLTVLWAQAQLKWHTFRHNSESP